MVEAAHDREQLIEGITNLVHVVIFRHGKEKEKSVEEILKDEVGNMFEEEDNDYSQTDSEMEWSENAYP